jgi:hypothetical protein
MFKQKFNFDLEFLKGIQSCLLLFGWRTFYLMKKSAVFLLGDPKPLSEYEIPTFLGTGLLERARLAHISRPIS